MVDVTANAAVVLETAADGARALAGELAAAGWIPAVVTVRKIRYWCPGPDCKHQTWVEVSPRSVTYFQNLIKHLHLATCWKEGPNDE